MLLSLDKNQSQDLNLWFILLRWIACGVALLLVIITIKALHYLDESTFLPLILLIILLGLTNLVFTVMVKRQLYLNHLKEIQIVSDLIILTVMLHYSGGIENPLSFVYLFHVILSGILLNKHKCYGVVAFAFFLYGSLALCELSGVIPHYTLQIFPHSESEAESLISPAPHVTPEAGQHEHSASKPNGGIHAAHYPVYVWSMSFLTFFIMLLTAYFITNIMDRLRAEETRTREERQRLEHVLQATGAGLLILDQDLQPVWYNEPVKTWLDIGADDPQQHTIVISDWIEGKEGPAAATLKNGNIRSIERERIDESGQKQFFQVTLAPLTDPKGTVYQVVELIQDVSEKKILEAEMIHAAKMVTLGTMSAGIAHEVGNPLASISTRLHLLKTEHEESFVEQSVNVLQREISRIERIVRGISQFGRPSKEGWALCQVNQILLETIEMLKYHKTAKLSKIETDLSLELPETLGVRDQLKQVFLNLGLNALEAIPGNSGTITIRSFAEKGTLKIEFIDAGSGIMEADQEKIFQPFFTTKEKGSGLGLFIVNHIVQAHSGQIGVKSKPGEGTQFIVTLPIHSPRRSSKSPGRPN